MNKKRKINKVNTKKKLLTILFVCNILCIQLNGMQSVKQVLIDSVDASDASNLQVKSMQSNLFAGGITVGTWGAGLAVGYLAYKASTSQDVSLTALKSDFSTYCRVVKSMCTLWNEDSRATIGAHPLMAASVIAIPGLMAGTFFGTKSHIEKKALEYYRIAHPATDPNPPDKEPDQNLNPEPEDDNPLPQPSPQSPQSPIDLDALTMDDHIRLAQREPVPQEGKLTIQTRYYSTKQFLENPNIIYVLGENINDKKVKAGKQRLLTGNQAGALIVDKRLGTALNRKNVFGFRTTPSNNESAEKMKQYIDTDIAEIRNLIAAGHHVVLPFDKGEVSIGRGVAVGELKRRGLDTYLAKQLTQLCIDFSAQKMDIVQQEK